MDSGALSFIVAFAWGAFAMLMAVLVRNRRKEK
jgi:hypothetical protein